MEQSGGAEKCFPSVRRKKQRETEEKTSQEVNAMVAGRHASEQSVLWERSSHRTLERERGHRGHGAGQDHRSLSDSEVSGIHCECCDLVSNF